MSWASFVQYFSFLLPSILDLGSVTGQTDRQTDNGRQCIMPNEGGGIIKEMITVLSSVFTNTFKLLNRVQQFMLYVCGAIYQLTVKNIIPNFLFPKCFTFTFATSRNVASSDPE